jgi:uncharacterized membrane protein YphA (DoxX/SURF4 family)
MTTYGARIYGLAAIALGLVGLAWGDFAAVWQPVPPDWPARTALAYLWAGLFVAGGVMLQLRRTAAIGALLVAALFLPFAALWAKRVIGFPQIFGTWSGFCEQLVLILGGIAAWLTSVATAADPEERRLARTVRLIFGLCLLAFGTAHFLYVKETAALVPAWLPPGTHFWAYATGACHALAGLALLSGIQAPLAARLLTAMFVGFGLLVWLPQLFTAPHEHMAWAGNAINFVLIGAAWAVAGMIAGVGVGVGADRDRAASPAAGED